MNSLVSRLVGTFASGALVACAPSFERLAPLPRVQGADACQTLLDLSAPDGVLRATWAEDGASTALLVHARRHGDEWEVTGSTSIPFRGQRSASSSSDGALFVSASIDDGWSPESAVSVVHLAPDGLWLPVDDSALPVPSYSREMVAYGRDSAAITVQDEWDGSRDFVLEEVGWVALPASDGDHFLEGPEGELVRGGPGGVFLRWIGDRWAEGIPPLEIDARQSPVAALRSDRHWAVTTGLTLGGYQVAMLRDGAWSAPVPVPGQFGMEVADLDFDAGGSPLLTFKLELALSRDSRPPDVQLVRLNDGRIDTVFETRAAVGTYIASASVAVVGDSPTVGITEVPLSAPDANSNCGTVHFYKL